MPLVNAVLHFSFSQDCDQNGQQPSTSRSCSLFLLFFSLILPPVFPWRPSSADFLRTTKVGGGGYIGYRGRWWGQAGGGRVPYIYKRYVICVTVVSVFSLHSIFSRPTTWQGWVAFLGPIAWHRARTAESHRLQIVCVFLKFDTYWSLCMCVCMLWLKYEILHYGYGSEVNHCFLSVAGIVVPQTRWSVVYILECYGMRFWGFTMFYL